MTGAVCGTVDRCLAVSPFTLEISAAVRRPELLALFVCAHGRLHMLTWATYAGATILIRVAAKPYLNKQWSNSFQNAIHVPNSQLGQSGPPQSTSVSLPFLYLSSQRACVGAKVGLRVGAAEGLLVGRCVGCLVGESVGMRVGGCVGDLVGAIVGDRVGCTVGTAVGDADGDGV